MCITKSELEQRVAELRSLKALKEETEAEIREAENAIIEFLNETEECEALDKNGKPIRQYIGTDYKATYSMQTRKGINKDLVKEMIGELNFLKVETESCFGVLRIK